MNDEVRTPAPPDRHLLGRWTPWIGVLVFAALCGAIFTASSATRRDREPADLDQAFVYDVARFRVIPPEMIGYRETLHVETGLEHATAVAVGPADEIVAGGDRRVVVFSSEGTRRHAVPLPDLPLCLALSATGDLFVGLRSVVLKGPLAGPLERWLTIPGEKARLTSMAVDRESLFVADAGARVIWHFALDGRRLGRIGDRDPERNVPGFVVPSPYFDVLLASDGLLRIVDPGRHQITAFTRDGDLELSWGQASYALEGFVGCCNPSHLALLPDGRFVTSEKGIARVKVYDANGRFVTAVVGPDGLDTEAGPCDVAVDSTGRILVLDPGRGLIRIFEPKPRRDRDD